MVGDARAIPARVNGENKSVWIQYSVDFRKIGDAKSIIVNPNWGFNRKAYGRHYISPQLYDAPTRSMYCHKDMSFTVQMQIDETGAIQDAEVIRGKASNKCQKTLVDFVEQVLTITWRNKLHTIIRNEKICFFKVKHSSIF